MYYYFSYKQSTTIHHTNACQVTKQNLSLQNDPIITREKKTCRGISTTLQNVPVIASLLLGIYTKLSPSQLEKCTKNWHNFRGRRLTKLMIIKQSG